VNRTDRLYAIVEELRAVAPRPRSARWLAGRFEVSVRTVERDISALQQSGVPIWAEPGRTGGYCLDKARTLPPVNLTPGEAVALAVALRQLDGTPFRSDAGTALRKLVAAMQAGDAAAAQELAERIHLLGQPGAAPPPAPMPRLVADALQPRRVLRIGYADRAGAVTAREIEPLGYVARRPLVPDGLVPAPGRGARLPHRPDHLRDGHRRGGTAAPAARRGPRHPAGETSPAHAELTERPDVAARQPAAG
jgi:predicted DNA-binding transcriptional regulator YafY